MVWCSYEAATCWAVLSIDVQRLAALGTDAAAFAARVAETVFGSHAGHLVPKLILVGNDIDVTEIDQVVWALATRAHPLHDHFAFRRSVTSRWFPTSMPRTRHEAAAVGW